MHLPAAAQFAEALKDRAGDFLNAAIRIEAEANLPMPDVADWYGKPELASSGLGPCGVQHSRSQNAKFEFADAALHARQQPIIRTTGIIDAIEIDDAGIDETAQLQQMMPVPSVTGEAGGIEAKHSADLASAQPGNELLEARARHGSARGAAQIVVDDLNIAKSPPAGFIDEVVLAALALEMDLHLRLRGLAHIHDRLAAQDCRRQGISVRHRRSPLDPRRRLAAEGGPDAESRRCDRRPSSRSALIDPATSRVDGVGWSKQSDATVIA